jgi:hypothetical protein
MPLRVISVRMKFVVPLTIPWIRWMSADHRDDARDVRLEAQPDAVLAGQRPELLAVLGEQLLVGRDHMPARPQRATDVLVGRIDSADQLDDQL